jgi:ParB family chromosome partitioning protein
MVAENAQVALASLAHALLQQLVIEGLYRPDSALNVRGHGCDSELARVAGDIETSRAWAELQGRIDGWRERIPGDPAQLMTWLIGQDQGTLVELLSLCSALSINTVMGREGDHAGDALVVAVGLDMADWWTPTTAAYLDHVPKVRIVEAVTEAVSADEGQAVGKLKKPEAVAKAVALLDGKRWLPTPLRVRNT